MINYFFAVLRKMLVFLRFKAEVNFDFCTRFASSMNSFLDINIYDDVITLMNDIITHDLSGFKKSTFFSKKNWKNYI